MQLTGKNGLKLAGKLGVAGALLLASGLAGNYAMATVTGRCDMCHTMHNSQDGNTQVFASGPVTAAHWAGDNSSLGGGASSASQRQLLKTDCVGCHSNTGSETIVSINSNRIPIVYNTGGYPAGATGSTHALAGGNFYNVAGNSAYGHNVLGISPGDSLFIAPGDQLGCAQSCHTSLALTDAGLTGKGSYNGFVSDTMSHAGCQGCHNKLGHHNTADTSYRYLGGHADAGMDILEGGGAPIVTLGKSHNPYEDADWEQSPDESNHNFYRAPIDLGSGAKNDRTMMGAFCAGCHKMFHAMGDNNVGARQNGGDPNGLDGNESGTGLITANSTPSNPWMRHPSSVNIPQDGEYGAMFGVSLYNPKVPVSRLDGVTSTTIQPGDQVFCLSCHRAHGSDQPDALRFPYTDMVAHSGTHDGEGCFYCHTSKDTAS